MKRKKVIVIIIIIIFILIPVSFAITDRIRYENGESTWFTRVSEGGEIVEYIGFGYRISYYFPLTTVEDESTENSSEWLWFWEY